MVNFYDVHLHGVIIRISLHLSDNEFFTTLLCIIMTSTITFVTVTGAGDALSGCTHYTLRRKWYDLLK